MSNVRQHLKTFHSTAKEHHASIAALHQKQADRLEDGDDKDFHAGMAKVHEKHSDFHEQCCEDVTKALASEVIKTSASSIPTEDVPDQYNPHRDLGKRLIVRPGQSTDPAKVELSSELESMFAGGV